MQNATLTGIENRSRRKRDKRTIVRFDTLKNNFATNPAKRLVIFRRWGKLTKNLIQTQSRGELIVEEYEGTEASTSFWIKPNGEIRSVCGQQKKEGICLQPAGASTRHNGTGVCRTCSKMLARKSIENTHIQNVANRLPSRLAECLEYAEKMEVRLLTKVDPDIKNLYGVLRYVMSGGLHPSVEELNEEDVKLVNILTRTIVEAKKARSLIEKEIRIDPVTIKSFVSQVMGVVFQNVEKDLASRIGNEILEKVVRPFKIEGRIAGTQEDYYPVSSDIANAIDPNQPHIVHRTTKQVHQNQKNAHRGHYERIVTPRSEDLQEQ